MALPLGLASELKAINGNKLDDTYLLPFFFIFFSLQLGLEHSQTHVPTSWATAGEWEHTSRLKSLEVWGI